MIQLDIYFSHYFITNFLKQIQSYFYIAQIRYNVHRGFYETLNDAEISLKKANTHYLKPYVAYDPNFILLFFK